MAFNLNKGYKKSACYSLPQEGALFIRLCTTIYNKLLHSEKLLAALLFSGEQGVRGLIMIKSDTNNSQIIESYLVDLLSSIKLLKENKLYAQSLTIILSAIDSFGLLDAPDNEDNASGKSFKSWVNKYFCENPGIEYTAEDLWAYRCSVLHTYTAQSKLSKSGKAREIVFYSGDKLSDKATRLSEFVTDIDNNKHVAANIEETILTFTICCQKFARDLDEKCLSSKIVKQRIGKLLHKAQW